MPFAEDMLARSPLFSMLPSAELAKLGAKCHDRRFPAGATLAEDDGAGGLFGLIVEGMATVAVHGEAVRTLGPGDGFGELALVDEGRRSSSVTAATDVRCLFLTKWDFRPFAMAHPEVAWALAELTVQRLREAEARRAEG